MPEKDILSRAMPGINECEEAPRVPQPLGLALRAAARNAHEIYIETNPFPQQTEEIADEWPDEEYERA